VITRDELYRLVWSMPMTKVAEKFEVSGNYMARICEELGVPRPQRGYWAKLAVGKVADPVALPEERPGDQLFWSRNDDPEGQPVVKPHVDAKPRLPRIARPVTGVHGLIRDAKKHFESGRPVDDGDHLKPYKKLLVDVTASMTGLDKALTLANDLFNALESSGHRVLLAPNNEQLHRDWQEIDEHEEPPKKRREHYDRYPSLWSPYRPTVVYVGTVAIGLAIIEMTAPTVLRYVKGKYIRDVEYVPPKSSRYNDDHTWTTTKDLPCGRFRLIAYSPYGRVSWSEKWQEKATAPLTKEIGLIVNAIEVAAFEMVAKLSEAERQAEIARLRRIEEEERRRREEDRRRVQQSIKDSRAQLEGIIKTWSEIVNLEQFFQGVSERVSNLPDDRRHLVLDRLKLAREIAGSQDPVDFFLVWKTPTELYQPQATSTGEQDDGDEDDQEDA
jgi:hypothetical protein